MKDNSLVQTVVRLTCPISGRLIENPVRGLFCSHIECFDLKVFLDLNKPLKCPICEKICPFLVLDRFIKNLISNCKGKAEVILNEKGEVMMMTNIKNLKCESKLVR